MLFLMWQWEVKCPLFLQFIVLFLSNRTLLSVLWHMSEKHMFRIPPPSHLTKKEGDWVIHSYPPPPPTSDDPSSWYSLISLSCSSLLTSLIEIGMSIKEPKNLLPSPHIKGDSREGVSSRRLRVCKGACVHAGECWFMLISSLLVDLLLKTICFSPYTMQKKLHQCHKETKRTQQIQVSASDFIFSKTWYSKLKFSSIHLQSVRCSSLDPVSNSHSSLNNACVTETCCSAPCSPHL